MKYIIYTPSAKRLKKEILISVSKKIDSNGKGIATWQCVETDTGDRALVHTTDQWAEKGCIIIQQVHSHNELQVSFHYWDSCDEKTIDDDKYILGRFFGTNLSSFLLLH